jgi:Helix-turn-helix
VTWHPPEGFGFALQSARILRGFSRTYVSRATHITVGRIRDIEEGVEPPDAHEWVKIWNVLSTGSPPPPPVLPPGRTS